MTAKDPADAVREALEHVIVYAYEDGRNGDTAKSSALIMATNAFLARIAALTARVAELEQANELLCRWKGRIDEARMSRGLEFPADYDNSPIYGVHSLLDATRLAALAGAGPVAPWPDFAGQAIHDRDRIRHPDGTTGVVLYLPDMGAGGEAWRVVYSGGDISRLALQVGDKGQAVVIAPHAPAKAREDDEWKAKLQSDMAEYAQALADERDAARWRFVVTAGKMPTRCSSGYYYEDGVIYATPEAAIDAALTTFAEGAE